MAPALQVITPAEDLVLQQLLQGRSNKAIAAALVLSPRTVECHISHLLAKCGCRSRAELLLWALGRPGGDKLPWDHPTAGLAQW